LKTKERKGPIAPSSFKKKEKKKKKMKMRWRGDEWHSFVIKNVKMKRGKTKYEEEIKGIGHLGLHQFFFFFF
jgi:hypothetical protein